MRILYITYADFQRTDSGSGVRPKAMYEAFLERGHEVYLLNETCGRGLGKKRREAVRKTVEWLRTHRPDLCYIESSTYPIMDSCDYRLIRLLRRKKIPTAYFYRDCYWKFPELYPRRTDPVGRLKELYLDLLWRRTDAVLRKVDIVYFPSEMAFRYFRFRDMRTLPPAGTVSFLPRHEDRRTCMYVGGLSEAYGTPMMLEAFKLLNHGDERADYKLILICRPAEYQACRAEIGEHPWLEVHHASGDELIPYYAQADVGLSTTVRNVYNDMAMPIKTFQYTSYGLPVIVSDTPARKQVVEENGFGIAVRCEPAAIAEAIRSLLDSPETLAELRDNIEREFPRRHLWVHRVDQIVEDLTGMRA